MTANPLELVYDEPLCGDAPVRLVVVGDALLDRDIVGDVDRVCPDAPVPVVDVRCTAERPGGAGLAAVLAARDGCDVTLVTGLAHDPAGDRLRNLLVRELRLCAVPLRGGTPVKTRVRAAGQSLLRIDNGGDGEVGTVPADVLAAIGQADGVLVSDYGGGLAARSELRAMLAELAARVPVIWDPHPRGAPPVPGMHLVTPNLAEAAGFAGPDGSAGGGAGGAAGGAGADGGGFAVAGRIAARLVERWQAGAVAVTMGRRGALLAHDGKPPLVAPVSTVHGAGAPLDSCGAGDRFAVTAATMLAARKLPSEAVVAAVRAATDFVLAGGQAVLRPCQDGQSTTRLIDHRRSGGWQPEERSGS